MAERIGIFPGVSILLHEDGRAEHRGGTKEEAYHLAARVLETAKWPAPKLDIIRRWVEIVSRELEDEEIEKRVRKAAEPRLKAGEKFFRKLPWPIEVSESVILEQERERLKKKVD